MIRRNLFCFLVLSLVISCVIAEETEESKVDDKKDEKAVSKRGVLHYSTHGHVHPAVVSATHYHLPPAFARIPHHHHHHKHLVPIAPPVLPVPPVFHKHFVPVAPPPVIPAAPHFHIAPGGASVTSYSVNYPRVPVYQKPIVPAFAPPVFTPAPALIPSYHHHHPSFHHSAFLPHYHPKPVISVAVPGIRHPKYPVFYQPQRPVFGSFPSSYVPFATPTPTFVPVAVPSNPQPPPPAANPGIDSNYAPATQNHPQIPMPTQPTFVQMPTTAHGWRPIIMMTQPHATQQTFTTNKHPNNGYNYHAPSVAFNHHHRDQSSSNDIISGHGQMSGQLAHQLALYHHQQQLIQQQTQQLIQQQQQESELTLRRFDVENYFKIMIFTQTLSLIQRPQRPSNSSTMKLAMMDSIKVCQVIKCRFIISIMLSLTVDEIFTCHLK
jgi:hypothetical protein